MKRNLSEADRTALRYLEPGGGTATHHVARACGFDRTQGDRATTVARTMLRRLARWGYVEASQCRLTGPVYWWAITKAGREAIGGEA